MKTQVEKTKLHHQNVNHQIFIMALRRKGFSDVISWPHSCWRLCGDSLYYLMHNGVKVFLKLHSISFRFSILWDTRIFSITKFGRSNVQSQVKFIYSEKVINTLWNPPLPFDYSTYSQTLVEDFAKLCGLLRIYELYFRSWNVTLKRLWPHFGSLFSQWENTNQPNNCLASLRLRSYFFLKFIFSKKATKIDEILTMYLPFTT